MSTTRMGEDGGVTAFVCASVRNAFIGCGRILECQGIDIDSPAAIRAPPTTPYKSLT